MKLTRSQKMFIKAGRILEAYKHDLKMAKQSPLYQLVLEEQLKMAKVILKQVLEDAQVLYRKEQGNG